MYQIANRSLVMSADRYLQENLVGLLDRFTKTTSLRDLVDCIIVYTLTCLTHPEMWHGVDSHCLFNVLWFAIQDGVTKQNASIVDKHGNLAKLDPHFICLGTKYIVFVINND